MRLTTSSASSSSLGGSAVATASESAEKVGTDGTSASPRRRSRVPVAEDLVAKDLVAKDLSVRRDFRIMPATRSFSVPKSLAHPNLQRKFGNQPVAVKPAVSADASNGPSLQHQPPPDDTEHGRQQGTQHRVRDMGRQIAAQDDAGDGPAQQ
jgi:hypothetical protein